MTDEQVGVPSPVFLYYCLLEWDYAYTKLSLLFLELFRDFFDEAFFLNPAHDFSKTQLKSLIFLRAVVDREVFTPKVLERFSLAFPKKPEALAVLKFSDVEIIRFIRDTRGNFIANNLWELMNARKAEKVTQAV